MPARRTSSVAVGGGQPAAAARIISGPMRFRDHGSQTNNGQGGGQGQGGGRRRRGGKKNR